MSDLPKPPATYTLGNSGLRVSPMAWGMWRFNAAANNAAEAAPLVHAALDAGITLLDTADIYGARAGVGFGNAEKLLGEVLAAEPSLRGRMVLASKAGISPGVPYDQSADYLRSAIDASLQRLGVDMIDLYQIHRPEILAHPQEGARTLDDAVAAGKIRALGVSNFTVHQIAALNSFLDTKLAVTQPQVSALHIDCFENGEFDQAMALDIRPLAWSPLAGGALFKPETERAIAVAEALDAFAQGRGIDRSIAAYSWLMAHPAGIIPIIGSQSPGRIADAARAVEVQWNRKDWYAVLVAARGQRLP